MSEPTLPSNLIKHRKLANIQGVNSAAVTTSFCPRHPALGMWLIVSFVVRLSSCSRSPHNHAESKLVHVDVVLQHNACIRELLREVSVYGKADRHMRLLTTETERRLGTQVGLHSQKTGEVPTGGARQSVTVLLCTKGRVQVQGGAQGRVQGAGTCPRDMHV